MHTPRILTAIPVYNESRSIRRVLSAVLDHVPDVLVIDDGSTDDTPSLVARYPVEVIRHARNRGYGRSLRDAFSYAACAGYDWLITMDCDEQHEPAAIPDFIEKAREGGWNRWDVVSGSRYLATMDEATAPPPDRRLINQRITLELNERLDLNLTDAFCGFKAHRVASLRRLTLTEAGYAFPMQFWVQGVAAGLRITEVPVRLIYNDLSRTFGGHLDDPTVRLAHYRHVLHCEIERCEDRLASHAAQGVNAGCGCRHV